MAYDITKEIVLEHIQAVKNDLQGQFNRMDGKVTSLEFEVRQGFIEMRQSFAEMRRGFEDARLHRQALQEDLDTTIRTVGKHETKITRLTKKRHTL